MVGTAAAHAPSDPNAPRFGPADDDEVGRVGDGGNAPRHVAQELHGKTAPPKAFAQKGA